MYDLIGNPEDRFSRDGPKCEKMMDKRNLRDKAFSTMMKSRGLKVRSPGGPYFYLRGRFTHWLTFPCLTAQSIPQHLVFSASTR